ncbi:MAG: hypothetical protein AB4206_10200, partial [Xenococcaceae cyanobacterium]
IPLGLNIGAIGERISQIPGGVVLEPHATPKKIVSEMIRLAEFSRANKVEHQTSEEFKYESIVNDYYQLNILMNQY